MNDYLKILSAVRSEHVHHIRKYQEGGTAEGTEVGNTVDATVVDEEIFGYAGRNLKIIGNKVYLLPKDENDRKSEEYSKAVNEFLNSKELVTLKNKNRNLTVGDLVSDEGSAEYQSALADQTARNAGNKESSGNTTITSPADAAMEEEERQKRIQKVGAGFSAYNSTIGLAGQQFGVNKVNNDLQDNDIHMNQDLRSSGSYGNVQENVNNANDHSKEQQIMAGRDAMISNVSSMGPYGAMIGTGLQAASTIMDSTGLTSKMFNRMTENERMEADRQKKMAEGIIAEGKAVTAAGQNGSGAAYANNQLNGQQQTNIQIGEDGMEVQPTTDHHKLVDLEDSSYNVIPSGALHAENHHLGAINPEFQGLTRKGIPVVSEEADGLLQHAEVERGEIIFRLALTERLLELASVGTYEAQVEAGRLLADEILHNTKDNIGLMKSLKKNGQVQG